jgi:hypothetical protein
MYLALINNYQHYNIHTIYTVLFESARSICFGHGGDGRAGSDGVSVGTSSAHLSLQPLITFSAGTPSLAAIRAGAGHACVLRCDARVMCFGWNSNGQLGRDNSLDYGGSGGDMAALQPVALDPGKVTYFTASATLSTGQVIAADICTLHTSVIIVDPTADVAISSWTPSAAVWTPDGGGAWPVTAHSTFVTTHKVTLGLASHTFTVALRGISSSVIVAGISHVCTLFRENNIACWGVST